MAVVTFGGPATEGELIAGAPLVCVATCNGEREQEKMLEGGVRPAHTLRDSGCRASYVVLRWWPERARGGCGILLST